MDKKVTGKNCKGDIVDDPKELKWGLGRNQTRSYPLFCH